MRRIDFWERVERSGDGCWLWKGRTNRDGYGLHVLPGQKPRRTQMAHRVAYESLIGPIPSGMDLDHLCRVRDCINPQHLEPVTHRENTLRGQTLTAANAAKTACVRGHEFTPDNTYVKPNGNRECWMCKRARRHGLLGVVR